MSARWWTLAVWALAAASALAWGLKLFVRPAAVPAHTQVAVPAPQAQGDLSRLLGVEAVVEVAAPAEPPPDARFQLIGVVSPRQAQAAREGLALIAVDGKPPRAYRVGALVDGQNVLQSVGARGATLGPRGGATLVALNLTPPPPAATGNLPTAVGMAPQPAVMPGARPAAAQMRPTRVNPALQPTPSAPSADPPPPPGVVPTQDGQQPR
jgi:general secretion pathway protein C